MAYPCPPVTVLGPSGPGPWASLTRSGQAGARLAAHTHQAFLLPAGPSGGGENDLHGLVVDTEGAGAAGVDLAVAVVHEDAEVAIARPDLLHEDVGAVVPERIGSAVEGLVVGVAPAAAGACGARTGPHPVPPELPPPAPPPAPGHSASWALAPSFWKWAWQVHPEPVTVISGGKRIFAAAAETRVTRWPSGIARVALHPVQASF